MQTAKKLIQLVVVLDFHILLVHIFLNVSLDVSCKSFLQKQSQHREVEKWKTRGEKKENDLASSNSPLEVKYLPTYIFPVVAGESGSLPCTFSVKNS